MTILAMRPILLAITVFALPLLGGIALGFVQLGLYRLLRRPAAQVPPLPILCARGVLMLVIVAIAMALLVSNCVS